MTAKNSHTKQAVSSRRDGLKDFESLDVSFFWGPWLGGFAAYIPSIQSWLTNSSSDELSSEVKARIRDFFKEDAGMRWAARGADQDATGTLPHSLAITAADSTRLAVRTAQAAAIFASGLEDGVPGLAGLAESGVRLLGWQRDTSRVRLPEYFSNRLQRAQAYFEEHLDELMTKHPGEYVAIIGQDVIFHHSDLDILTEHVYATYDERPIFIDKVEAGGTPVVPIMLTEPEGARSDG